MNRDDHQQHQHAKAQAKGKAGKVEERLEEKTLHGHTGAMHRDTRHMITIAGTEAMAAGMTITA